VKIAFHPDVFKALQRLPRSAFPAVLTAIVALADDPRPSGVRKLVGSERDWRIGIGEYRVVYEIDDAADRIVVMVVAHRRDVYR